VGGALLEHECPHRVDGLHGPELAGLAEVARRGQPDPLSLLLALEGHVDVIEVVDAGAQQLRDPGVGEKPAPAAPDLRNPQPHVGGWRRDIEGVGERAAMLKEFITGERFGRRRGRSRPS
jgi:hypothetical protein